MTEKELIKCFSNTYLHLRKDILTSSNHWLNISDKDIYIISNLSVTWQRKQYDKPTYKISFNLHDFYRNEHEVNLYKELNEMDYNTEAKEYLLKDLFVLINI